MTFIPKLNIKTGYTQGYGGPDEWWIRVIFENIKLDSATLSSERDLGRKEVELEGKWKKSWPNEKTFRDAIKKCPEASPLCSACGKDTLEGGCSCLNRYWCDRPACKKELDKQIKESKQATIDRESEWKRKDGIRKEETKKDNHRGYAVQSITDEDYCNLYVLKENGIIRFTKIYDDAIYPESHITLSEKQWSEICEYLKKN